MNLLVRWFGLAAAAVLAALPVRADLADTLAQVKPAIALVGTFNATSNPRFALRGTGFVAAVGGLTQSNRVVTNAHVLDMASDPDPQATWVVQVRTGTSGWETRAARVLEADAQHDLALLAFEGAPVKAFQVRDSGAVREGDALAFMGFPIGGALGFSPVTHRATVSSIAPAALPMAAARQLTARTLRSLRVSQPFDIFQLDATAYPGNSGGPLFDPQTGEVLGVINMVVIKGVRESALTHPSGISYAIPSRFVLELLNRHLDH